MIVCNRRMSILSQSPKVIILTRTSSTISVRMKCGYLRENITTTALINCQRRGSKMQKISDFPDPEMNYFSFKSRQSLEIWRENGWIVSPDPR